jgi:hypothetical protein
LVDTSVRYRMSIRVDQVTPPEQNAVPTDRGNLSKRGGSGCGGVRGMDAAAKPMDGFTASPATGPTPPTHRKPAFDVDVASGRHYGGCRVQPCRTNPTLRQRRLCNRPPRTTILWFARRRAPVFLLSAPCAASANLRYPWSSNRASAASSASPPTRPAARPRSSSRSTTSARPPIQNGPKRVLVIGASTGYGLAARITAAFGSGAATLGIFFERPGSEPSRAPRAGTTRPRSTSTPTKPACTPRASTAMPSPMK